MAGTVTVSDRLVSRSSKDKRYAIRIAGVPCDITEGLDAAAPTAAGAVDGRGMLVSALESATKLDRQKRVQTGGGFTAVVQDREGLLAALFAVRSFRATHIRSNTTRTVTTVNVGSTATLPAAGVVYVAGETIAYTSKAATQLLGCTRGAFGSRAQAHRGGTDNGASVFTVPPAWLGRRVTFEVTFRDDSGALDTSTTEVLGTFRLEAAPVHLGEQRWELRCSHLSDEFNRRKIGTGIEEIKTPGTLAIVEDGGASVGRLLRLTTVRGVAEKFTPGTLVSYALIQFAGASDARSIFRIYDVVADSGGLDVDVIRLYGAALTSQGQQAAGLAATIDTLSGLTGGILDQGGVLSSELERIGRLEVEWIKHIAILDNGSPSTLLRIALESEYGDNGAYDLLPGVEPTTLGGPGFRFGAGVPTAEIDTTSLNDATIASGWTYVIDEEMSVDDIRRDYCRDSNTAAIWNAAGQLTFVPLIEDRSTSAGTIAEAHLMSPVAATIAEDSIYGRARIECNYDPIDGEYEGTIDVIDEDIAATYAPAEGSLVVRSRSLMVDPIDVGGAGSLLRPVTQLDEILPALRRTMLDSRGGTLVLSFKADGRHLTLPLGALVDLSLPSVGDFRGGTLASARGRIVERSPDWTSMTVDLTVIVEEILWHFAPFGVVASVAAPVSGDQTITLTVDPWAPDGANAFRPESGALYDYALVLSAATGAPVGDGVSIVSIASATSFVVTDLNAGSPSLPLVAGQIIVYYQSTRFGAESTAGAFTPADYAHQDGANFDVDDLTRWR